MKVFPTLNVIIADDTSFLRASLSKHLEDMGFLKGNIHEFENGRLAYQFLKSKKIKVDFILSDWNMPNMTGLDFLKKVRASEEDFKDIPFFLVTTVSEKEKIIEAVQYKVSGYLLKPVEVAKLKDSLLRFFF